MLELDISAPKEAAAPAPYLVLARKYRPKNFKDLRGQDALVRTLTNAIETGRVAHAFILTGVRGVGKTTTARIIARALNCIGVDGQGKETIEPCGVCTHCQAILNDRHVDVIEMDAASQTGVDNIRQIIESVQYAPSTARYKIYIIDEVHMLSKSAFNALLKTLEEPPPHTKFIFATTEIKKVPVTVLSRCQRFDLKRIDAAVLKTLFSDILKAEKRDVSSGALELIARAADGSARDGLSLLDQAIARTADHVSEEIVRDMLGLADRSLVIDLFEFIHKGDQQKTFQLISELHQNGADPLAVLHDLLDFTHFLTKVKIAPESVQNVQLPEAERTRGKIMAESLTMQVLGRSWQILMKGVQELQISNLPQQSFEMIVMRLIYASDLPDPSELVKKTKEGMTQNQHYASSTTAPAPSSHGLTINQSTSYRAAEAVAIERELALPQQIAPKSFHDIIALLKDNREAVLYAGLYHFAHPIKIEGSVLHLALLPGADKNLIPDVQKKLKALTGQPWLISVTAFQDGMLSLAEEEKKKAQVLHADIQKHPLIQNILTTFKGAKIIQITTPQITATDIPSVNEGETHG